VDGACLVLDFDGTILDTEEPVYRAWSELWADHGEELALADWQGTIGTGGVFDPWARLEERLGRPLDPRLHERRRARRDELQRRHRPRSGILRWLYDAARLGVPVGIASSSPADWVEGHLERLGLRDRFACLVGSDDRVPPKPDPTSYRLCCAALDADPARSVAVEDSMHGVAAAVAVGLYTVAYPHDLTVGTDLSAADLVVPSLAAVSLTDALDEAVRRGRVTS
jgi:HAD superfamily hydrolase (TIGR01509 family)